MVVVLSSSCSRAITLTQFQAARSSLFGGLIPQQQPRWHPPPLGETDRWWEWFSSSPNWMGDVIRSYFLRLRLRFATDAFVSLFAPNRAMFCSIRNACRSTLSGNISKKYVIQLMIIFRRMYQSNFLWWVERFRDFNDLPCEHNEKELVVLSLFHFGVDLLLFLRWCVRKFSSLQSFTEFSQKIIWWQTVYEWIVTFFKTDQCQCGILF